MAEQTKKYTIIQFDGDPFYKINLELLLESIDQKLAAFASNANEANQVISRVTSGAIKPDVAIIDDYMGNSWQEGEKIAAKIRSISPNTKIIGYSILRDEKPEWADAYAIKSGLDNQQTIVKKLIEVLGIKIELSNVVEGDEY